MAKKINTKADKQKNHHHENPEFLSAPKSQRGKSQRRAAKFRDPEDGFELTARGKEAYEILLALHEPVDLRRIGEIEEREPGDIEKLVRVFEGLALGARVREVLESVDWTWPEFQWYRTRNPVVLGKIHTECRHYGEKMRRILREDEAHRRAVEGTSEPIYSASGVYCGEKIKYSDTLLSLFLKADNPSKFSERVKVESTGVVLNMNMGLRENVRDRPMEQGDIKVTSPFKEEKPEEPGGV
jgi:hypothetical protein